MVLVLRDREERELFNMKGVERELRDEYIMLRTRMTLEDIRKHSLDVSSTAINTTANTTVICQPDQTDEDSVVCSDVSYLKIWRIDISLLFLLKELMYHL